MQLGQLSAAGNMSRLGRYREWNRQRKESFLVTAHADRCPNPGKNQNYGTNTLIAKVMATLHFAPTHHLHSGCGDCVHFKTCTAGMRPETNYCHFRPSRFKWKGAA
jgi:hypothetical protein